MNYDELESYCTSLESSRLHTSKCSLAPRLSSQNCKGFFCCFKVLLSLNSQRTMRFPRKPRSHLKILKYISNVAYSLDLICNFTECGMEFQTDTPIVVKDFSIFSVLENFTEKHWMIVDDRGWSCITFTYCTDFQSITFSFSLLVLEEGLFLYTMKKLQIMNIPTKVLFCIRTYTIFS